MSLTGLIKRRRLQMLIHSCMYYRYSTSIWTDLEFDTKARELMRLQNAYPDLSKQIIWAKEFEGWDGTTGFDLPIADRWVDGITQSIIKLEKERGN